MGNEPSPSSSPAIASEGTQASASAGGSTEAGVAIMERSHSDEIDVEGAYY
jgi:hypothetical protein